MTIKKIYSTLYKCKSSDKHRVTYILDPALKMITYCSVTKNK